MNKSTYVNFTGTWLGELEFTEQRFSKEAYAELSHHDLTKLSAFEKHRKIASILLREIQAAEAPCFLLPHVLSFIREVRAQLLPTFTFDSFEFQLLHFCDLSKDDLFAVCGKIMGRYIPRCEYQAYFPIGTNKQFSGPNISVAHLSPDVDTCVASHICFMDAFAARVTDSLHHWRVPGGEPQENADIDFIFEQPYGKDVFSILAKTEKEIEVSCMDLVTQKNMVRKHQSDLSFGGPHDRSQNAVIVVDDEGRYIADWRFMDIDSVRSICSWFMTMLTEYETRFHVGLISLFAQKALDQKKLKSFISDMLARPLSDCKITREFSDAQRINLHRFFLLVLKMNEGYSSTVQDFFNSRKEDKDFTALYQKILTLADGDLFDDSGMIIEDRSKIFSAIEEIFSLQTAVFQKFFSYLDTLDVALRVKKDVLEYLPSPISHLSSVEDVISEFKNYSHLTVTYEENEDHYALGVIHLDTLRKRYLGSVNIRDFSNYHEMIKPEFLEVISVIDHHKSEIRTDQPSLVRVQDAQSTNAVTAEISMQINDSYTTLGMNLEEIEEQINEVSKNLDSASNRRILQRLLKRKHAALERKPYFVSVEREFLELFQCLVAILDDTDFLTKVTPYDVHATRDILNRLVSLKARKELEAVHFDELSMENPNYASLAAKKLLQSQHLYSLYSKSGRAKEKKVEELIKKAAKDQASARVLMQDTKVLSKYARITQFKHFMSNSQLVEKKRSDLQALWQAKAESYEKEFPAVNLHLFMLTSIASAEELYSDFPDRAFYRDELWIWVPPNDKKADYQLRQFLEEFHVSPKMKFQDLEVELHGKDIERYEQVVKEAFKRSYTLVRHRSGPSIMVIKVEPKSLTSRKTQIAPYL